MDAPLILPVVTPENAHFWQGGADGRLQFQRCVPCGFLIHPPSPVCLHCHGTELDIATVSGDAVVASFTVNHQAWRPGLAVPYVIAIVELPEQTGLRLTTNIVGCPPEAVHIGVAVQVVFEQVEDVWLPLFTPRREAT
jgi:uncharacterized OB-fold protein